MSLHPCPRCHCETEGTVWPFLIGVDAGNEPLVWRRCPACHALYTDHTLPDEPRYGGAYVDWDGTLQGGRAAGS
jgi:hypothetical protein